MCKVKAPIPWGAGDSYISSFLTNYLSVEADESLTTENKITASLKKAADCGHSDSKDGALGWGMTSTRTGCLT